MAQVSNTLMLKSNTRNANLILSNVRQVYRLRVFTGACRRAGNVGGGKFYFESTQGRYSCSDSHGTRRQHTKAGFRLKKHKNVTETDTVAHFSDSRLTFNQCGSWNLTRCTWTKLNCMCNVQQKRQVNLEVTCHSTLLDKANNRIVQIQAARLVDIQWTSIHIRNKIKRERKANICLSLEIQGR